MAEASPQASLASAHRRAGISGACRHCNRRRSRSTGAEPGDVAEEGKLFERVSFDSFDKSPQS